MVSFQAGKVCRNTPYWARHRVSPQSDYWVLEGQQLVSKIQRLEKKGSLYGWNTYYRFDSKEAYDAKVRELRESGERILGEKRIPTP